MLILPIFCVRENLESQRDVKSQFDLTLASKDFTEAKNVMSRGARPDDHWFKSPNSRYCLQAQDFKLIRVFPQYKVSDVGPFI